MEKFHQHVAEIYWRIRDFRSANGRSRTCGRRMSARRWVVEGAIWVPWRFGDDEVSHHVLCFAPGSDGNARA